MDMDAIIQMISSVGFPIVACCAIFYLYNQTITKITNTLELLNKSVELLAEEIKKDKDDVGGN